MDRENLYRVFENKNVRHVFSEPRLREIAATILWTIGESKIEASYTHTEDGKNGEVLCARYDVEVTVDMRLTATYPDLSTVVVHVQYEKATETGAIMYTGIVLPESLWLEDLVP